MDRWLSKLFFLFVFSFAPGVAWAAACCGGGFASPSLIAGDEKAMATAGYTYSEINKDVYPDGLWSKRDFHESFETLRLEGAHIFKDRWQAGLSAPLVQRRRGGHRSSGLGDVNSTLGYEYLPDWDYNPWRPKGLGFLQVTLPTGRSVYQTDSHYQLDSRGRGFWAVGVGSLLSKSWIDWDAFLLFDVHRSLPKGDLRPGWGGNLTLGGGYNWRSLRFGPSVMWTYEDPVHRKNLSRGSSERYATAAMSISYLHSDEWAATLTYSDQSVLGNPVNARLGQSAMFQVQRRWGR